MKHSHRKRTYAEREMCRRRAEARYRFITRVQNVMYGILLAICAEASMFLMVLMA